MTEARDLSIPQSGGSAHSPTMANSVRRGGRRWGRRTIILVITVLAFLVGLRAALPFLVVRYVNHTLGKIPGYRGSIADVDIALIRGAYTIHDLKLLKANGQLETPMVQGDSIDLSIQWAALFLGKVVGEIEYTGGSLNFIRGKSAETSQTKVGDEWLQAVKDLFPLRLNRFLLRDVEVSFRDNSTSPPISVRVTQVNVEGSDFSNTRSPTDSKAATINATGLLEGKSPLKIRSKVESSARNPTFDARASLESLPLTSLNDLFEGYGSFDVQRGSGAFYMVLNANNGKVSGSLKPIIKDIEIFDLDEEDRPLVSTFWEASVGALAEVFENQRTGEIATIVPLEGDMKKVEGDRWDAFVGIVRNAFFKAVKPGWDSTTSKE